MLFSAFITIPSLLAWQVRKAMPERFWEKMILIPALCAWGWVWDFSNVKDGSCLIKGVSCQKLGRAKVFLFAAAAVAAVRISKTWHWSVGLFWAYITLGWIQQGRYGHSVDELVCITAALFLIPEIAKRVSDHLFENIILATSIGHCLIGILNIQGIFPFLKVTVPLYAMGKIPVGLLGQETLLAPYLAFAAAIAIHRVLESYGSERWFYGTIAALNLILIATTQSSMGYLSALTIIPVFVLFYRGFESALTTCLAMALAGGLILLNFPGLIGFSGRLGIWTAAVELIGRHPWIGYGPGSWRLGAEGAFLLGVNSGYWETLHSEFLQGQFQYGALGMILVAALYLRTMGIIYALHILGRREMVPYVCGFVLLSANGLANFTLHVIPHGALWAYCLYKILRDLDQGGAHGRGYRLDTRIDQGRD